MTSERSSVIQFTDHQDADSELQFQDFGHEQTTSAATLKPTTSYTSFPDSPDLGEDESSKLLSEEEEEKKSGPSVWEFSYYQSFFNINTDQVIQRILWSMIPLPGRATYLDRQIRPTPDLYGPFWIATTLIFSIAISANIADYFVTEGQDNKIWHYDFHKVSLAATAIYSYVFALPFALWGLMWYRQSSERYTLLEILCVYGYSLFIYIPISILWVIQVSWLQWMLVLVGAALSGSVLMQTFWPTLRGENKKIAAVVLCLILLFHTMLAVGFVAYFFRPTHSPNSATVIPTSSLSTISTLGPIIHSKSEPHPAEHITKKVSREIANTKEDSNINKLSNMSSTFLSDHGVDIITSEEHNLSKMHIISKGNSSSSTNVKLFNTSYQNKTE